MRIRIIKILAILFLFGLARINFTNSSLSDQETSTATMTAGTWSTALELGSLSMACDPDETSIDLTLHEGGQKVVLRIYGCGVSQFDTADYVLTYDSDQGTQGAIGTIKIDGKNDISELISLGSYSTGGTFIPNTGVKTVKVEVTLKGLIERKLTKEITL